MKSVDNVLLLLVFNEINYLFLGLMISLIHTLVCYSLLFGNHNFPSKCPAMTGWENS